MWILLALACTNEAPERPTWYADVAPLVDTHCARCHAAGGVGGVDLTDPEGAVALAGAMVTAVESGRMPPPASDPACQDYVGSDGLVLSDEERATLVAWEQGGAPLGDPASEVEVAVPSAVLSEPDLELRLSAPYAPAYVDPENAANEYRCFVLDPGQAEDFYVTAMAPIVDEVAMVHHVVLFKAVRNLLPAAALDPSGYDCINGSEVENVGMLAAWAPGMLPVELPAGVGMFVGSDEVFVLQMHYYDNGRVEGLSDQSGYAMRITDTAEHAAQMAPLGISDFVIPAGEPAHEDGDSFENSYLDLTVYGLFPHMHLLGQRFSASIVHEDGSETCLVEGAYDFANQMTYQYLSPIDFDVGDRLVYSCTWNNSESNADLFYSPPQDVRYGERTDEEMCFMFTLVAPS
ncbi:MAG: hypothetical protein Q8P18_19995 [Pseudomonadota bacterium]|nr:hypothetical protein [Pseudomonadota bacterium]